MLFSGLGSQGLHDLQETGFGLCRLQGLVTKSLHCSEVTTSRNNYGTPQANHSFALLAMLILLSQDLEVVFYQVVKKLSKKVARKG